MSRYKTAWNLIATIKKEGVRPPFCIILNFNQQSFAGGKVKL